MILDPTEPTAADLAVIAIERDWVAACVETPSIIAWLPELAPGLHGLRVCLRAGALTPGQAIARQTGPWDVLTMSGLAVVHRDGALKPPTSYARFRPQHLLTPTAWFHERMRAATTQAKAIEFALASIVLLHSPTT